MNNVKQALMNAGIALEQPSDNIKLAAVNPSGKPMDTVGGSLKPSFLEAAIARYEAEQAQSIKKRGPTKLIQLLHKSHQIYAQAVARKIVRRTLLQSLSTLVEIFEPTTKTTTKQIRPEIYLERWIETPAILDEHLTGYQVSTDHRAYAAALVKAGLSPYVSKELRKKLMWDVVYLPEVPNLWV